MSRFGRLTDAPASFRLTGARVLDPASDGASGGSGSAGTDGVRDLAVVEGRLADAASAPADLPTIDGRGLVAAPGLCDLHAHLREPGAEGAETIESGTRAAAKGGFTTVCAMPNTEPPLDEPARVAWVVARAASGACRVRVVAAATRGRAGDALSELGALAEAGAVAVSDDGAALPSASLARSALAYLRPLSMPLIEHTEEATLADGALMRSGPTATRLGLTGWPPSAELIVVDRDIALAEETGGRVHLTHLSTAASVEAVRRAKERGVSVSCDVTPHHLALTDAWVAGSRSFAWDDPHDGEPLDPAAAYDGACRVNPPLPSRDDALALLRGVADGTVDAIATDHAPHPPDRTLVPFAEAAPGMIGLETALSLGLAAVDAGCLTLPALIAALSLRPARIIGERRSLADGMQADLCVFDPAARWRVEAGGLASRSSNTPLIGMLLPGVVRLTVADGRITWSDGLI